MVLEHLTGGELLDQLQAVSNYSEAIAAQIFRQVRDEPQGVLKTMKHRSKNTLPAQEGSHHSITCSVSPMLEYTASTNMGPSHQTVLVYRSWDFRPYCAVLHCSRRTTCEA
jgi:hypothetical protein